MERTKKQDKNSHRRASNSSPSCDLVWRILEQDVKYICRYKNKNGIEDLKKVIHYAELLIQMDYGDDVLDKTLEEIK